VAAGDDERDPAATWKQIQEVMASVAKRAWMHGLEDEVMAAVYDVLNAGVDTGDAADDQDSH